MKRFDEILAATRMDYETVTPVYHYFAYKYGNAIQCASMVEAQATSKIYEKVYVNEAEVKASIRIRRDFEAQLRANFFNDVKGLLIKEYPLVFDTDPSKWDAIFNRLMTEASREFSSSDDIAERMDELASMMQSILKMHFK